MRGKNVTGFQRKCQDSSSGNDKPSREGLVIAIDGPSGSGKSTAAKQLSERLGYIYINTGAMYRAVALKAKQIGLNRGDHEGLAALCRSIDIVFRKEPEGIRVICNGDDVTEAIQTPEMSLLASDISRIQGVREALVELQRRLGERGKVVLEGRDIGTVVFPKAHIKFFLDAAPDVRSLRRYEELKGRGARVDLENTKREMRKRDTNDQARAIAPLKRAADAILIDSTDLGIGEVVEKMVRVFRQKIRDLGGAGKLG
jgi:cytidylate kinase